MVRNQKYEWYKKKKQIQMIFKSPVYDTKCKFTG